MSWKLSSNPLSSPSNGVGKGRSVPRQPLPYPQANRSRTPSTPLEITKLSYFLEAYQALFREFLHPDYHHVQQTMRGFPPKIAIIDSGMARPSSSNRTRDVVGASFVYQDGKESPWFLPIDPHGTQMAAIIQELNPECKLYVARICSEKGKLLSERVSKVGNHVTDPALVIGVHPARMLTMASHLHRQLTGPANRKSTSSTSR